MKKPDAITEIRSDNYKDKVWPLHCSEMIYCGRATTAKLARFGITTIGDVANADPNFLKGLLGVNGLALWTYANGADHSRVIRILESSFRKNVRRGRLPFVVWQKS